MPNNSDPNNFEGFVQEHTEISCTRCNNFEISDFDYGMSIEEFIENGWRATNKHCYCPECAKKFLKNETN